MAYTIQLRRDTAANWASVNPIPFAGEPCYETDTGKMKIGDGTAHYVTLAYFAGTIGDFLGLTDTPDSYTGQAAKVVAVKTDESGLEFVSPAGGVPGPPGPAGTPGVGIAGAAGDGVASYFWQSENAPPTGTYKKFYADRDGVISWCRLDLPNADGTGMAQVTVKLNGVNIYTSNPMPTVLPGAGLGSECPPNTTAFLKGDYFTIQVINNGGTSGRLRVNIRFTYEGANPVITELPYYIDIDGTNVALDLCAEVTVGVSTGRLRQVVKAGSLSFWQLIAGTSAHNPAGGVARPNDYNGTTNAKIWVRVLGF